jgi:hypothetical protein
MRTMVIYKKYQLGIPEESSTHKCEDKSCLRSRVCANVVILAQKIADTKKNKEQIIATRKNNERLFCDVGITGLTYRTEVATLNAKGT